jgi:hypothetical protein
MRLKKRVPSGREKDAAAIAKLEQLREKLYSDNPSVARHSAFNLSWMQEDGYDILKEALFSSAPRLTKGAAAYGLRKMRGRMSKCAIALIEEGAKDKNISTRQVCERALSLEKEAKAQAAQQLQRNHQPDSQPQPRERFKPKFRISEISHKSPRERPRSGRGYPPNASRFNR